MAILYVVSTPIGNLKDVSLRALEALKEVDLILCEDTRVTKKLLDRYNIKTPTLSYHQHSQLKKVEYISGLLGAGKNLALVSDAGTPGISDPGGKLIQAITTSPHAPPTQNFGVGVDVGTSYGVGIKIVPIPGPSAVTAAASISGFPMDKFIFMGFPPHKKKRKKFFEEVVRQLADSKYPVIFYESPHRIIKTLKELGSLIEDRKVVVCRELTKKFETIYRGTIEEVIKQLEKNEIRGEFVVVVGVEKRR